MASGIVSNSMSRELTIIRAPDGLAWGFSVSPKSPLLLRPLRRQPGPDVSGPTIAAFAFGERFAPRLRQTDHKMTVHVVLDESLQKGPVDLGV